jgi:hypothetical protein
VPIGVQNASQNFPSLLSGACPVAVGNVFVLEQLISEQSFPDRISGLVPSPALSMRQAQQKSVFLTPQLPLAKAQPQVFRVSAKAVDDFLIRIGDPPVPAVPIAKPYTEKVRVQQWRFGVIGKIDPGPPPLRAQMERPAS